MIPRYSRPEMTKIWSPGNYFRIQLEIETYACEAQEKLGVIPKGVALSMSIASARSSATSITRPSLF